MWYRTQSAEAVSDDLHRDHAALNFVEHNQVFQNSSVRLQLYCNAVIPTTVQASLPADCQTSLASCCAAHASQIDWQQQACQVPA